MNAQNEDMLIKHRPMQLIKTDEGLVLKRGVQQTEIRGNRVAEIVQALLSLTVNGDKTIREIIEYFPESIRTSISDMINVLLEKNLLYTGNGLADNMLESSLDIFYWNFNTTADAVNGETVKNNIVIIGVNHISKRIAASLAESGITAIKVVDFAGLRNMRMFDQRHHLKAGMWPSNIDQPLAYEDWAADIEYNKPDCIIATSDFGGYNELAIWNKYCVEEGIHFFPVLLDNMIGYAGPIVIPGETACFECFVKRLQSNMTGHELHKKISAVALQGQIVNGFHPSLAYVLGDIAVIELLKFYGKAFLKRKSGEVVEVNLINTEVKSRKVLKLPRCKVCGSFKKYNEKTTSKLNFLVEEDYVR